LRHDFRPQTVARLRRRPRVQPPSGCAVDPNQPRQEAPPPRALPRATSVPWTARAPVNSAIASAPPWRLSDPLANFPPAPESRPAFGRSRTSFSLSSKRGSRPLRPTQLPRDRFRATFLANKPEGLSPPAPRFLGAKQLCHPKLAQRWRACIRLATRPAKGRSGLRRQRASSCPSAWAFVRPPRPDRSEQTRPDRSKRPLPHLPPARTTGSSFRQQRGSSPTTRAFASPPPTQRGLPKPSKHISLEQTPRRGRGSLQPIRLHLHFSMPIGASHDHAHRLPTCPRRCYA
jgi:hypothetical protein